MTQSEQRIFEEEVRRVCRALWPNSPNNGPSSLLGRERDGIFETDETIHIVEATVSKKKDKARTDINKSIELARNFRANSSGKFVKIWFVTSTDPTVEQSEVGKRARTKAKLPVEVISYKQLSSRIVDGPRYLEIRSHYPFGSIRSLDNDDSTQVDEDEYIMQSITSYNGVVTIPIKNFSEQMLNNSGYYALVGEYGAGKSMSLRYIYSDFRTRYLAGETGRFPVYVNLRDHFGQSDTAEAMLRHGTRLGFEQPSRLTAAWRAGFVDLILDGFDELSSAALVRGVKGLRLARRQAVRLIHEFARERHEASLILVAGRKNYFDSDEEMFSSLSLSDKDHVWYVNEFEENQIAEYIGRKGIGSGIPIWLPSRPLLIGYLASRGLLTNQVGEASLLDMHPSEGWDYLLDRVCSREARQIDPVTISPPLVRTFVERLSTRARGTTSGRGPIGLRDIDDVLSDVFGVRPDESSERLILRMPGLTTDSENENTREFLDDDFVDACRAGDIVRLCQDPYGFDGNVFSNMGLELGELGISVAARSLSAMTSGQISNAMDAYCEGYTNRLPICDLLRVLQYLDLDYVGCGIAVNEEILEKFSLNGKSDFSRISFQGCYFGRLEVPEASIRKNSPKFNRCDFGIVSGATSTSEFERIVRQQNCTIEHFSDEILANSDVFGTNLPMAIKVLLATLRKLFLQRGSGRQESALFRGMDHAAKQYVPDILKTLESHDVIRSYSRRGPKIWIPNRQWSHEVREILEQPQTSRSKILKDIRSNLVD